MKLVMLLMTAALVGCQSGPDTERAARAAEIANQITVDPANAEMILASEGLEPTEYQSWLYEIAADPVETQVYLENLRAPVENPYTPDGNATPRPSTGRPPGIGEGSP